MIKENDIYLGMEVKAAKTPFNMFVCGCGYLSHSRFILKVALQKFSSSVQEIMFDWSSSSVLGHLASRNDVIFKNSTINSFLQVIFNGTYWVRTQSLLFKEEERRSFLLKQNCQRLEGTMMEIFNKFGWKFRSKIEYQCQDLGFQFLICILV